MTHITRSEQETIDLGRRLGATLQPGAIVLLSGDLGAGKTAFVRGLAQGLGANPDEVTSPTFTLIQEYRGRLSLFHVDLYRLEPREIPDLALEELGDGAAVVAIEWAERLPAEPEGVIAVAIEDRGDDVRTITILGADGAAAIPRDSSEPLS